jgi:HSP20 family molecular chaperone IbpA
MQDPSQPWLSHVVGPVPGVSGVGVGVGVEDHHPQHHHVLEPTATTSVPLADGLIHHQSHDPTLGVNGLGGPLVAEPQHVTVLVPQTSAPLSSSASNVGMKQGQARIFFAHYLNVRPEQADSPLAKATVHALYKHMIDDEFKYDYANFSNALYVWTSEILMQMPGGPEAIEDAFQRFETIKANSISKSRKSKDKTGDEQPMRKRQRKQKTPEDLIKDKCKALMGNTTQVPFVTLKRIDELDNEDKFAQDHPHHIYSLEQLHEWEVSPGHDEHKQPRSVSLSLTYSIKEDDAHYLVFVNVPYFVPNSLMVRAGPAEVNLEGVISLPHYVDFPNKQVNVEQLREVGGVTRHSLLPLGKFSQKIDLPKPVNSSTFEVSSNAGLVIVLLEKQVCSVSKPVVL